MSRLDKRLANRKSGTTGVKGMSKILWAMLLLVASSFLSLQASAHDHGVPAFVQKAQLVSALINADVYEDDLASAQADGASRIVQDSTGNAEDVRSDYVIVNPHGHIHWYKPYFNHTHGGNNNPDHMHSYVQQYVAVDTLEPVTPHIVAASFSPDSL